MILSKVQFVSPSLNLKNKYLDTYVSLLGTSDKSNQ